VSLFKSQSKVHKFTLILNFINNNYQLNDCLISNQGKLVIPVSISSG